MNKKVRAISLSFKLLLSLLCVVIFSGSVMAATLDVCPSGCTHSSIQNAVDASSDG